MNRRRVAYDHAMNRPRLFVRTASFVPACAWLLSGCFEPVRGTMDAGADALIQMNDAPVDAYVLPDVWEPGMPVALYDLESTGFFDQPWPSDTRLTTTGHPDMTNFMPRRGLVGRYIDAVEAGQEGFGTMGSVYFRFGADVDVATLPSTLEASVLDDASVLLIALDEGVPMDAVHHPVVTYWEPRQTIFWPGRTLAIRAADGFPLLPNTTYAAVVTERVHPSNFVAFERDTDFADIVRGDARVAAERAVLEPALMRLAALGVPTESILNLAVFTTQHPTAAMAQVRDDIVAAPAPVIPTETWTRTTMAPTFVVSEGVYTAPNFQSGTSPYQTEGGAILFDAEGHAIQQGTFSQRFALSVPVSAMPPEGYPIALYGHGTGGDYRSFVDDDTAELLAAQGIAVMGIDALFHGTRNPMPANAPDLLFFNIANPNTARFNPVQAALDHVVQGHVVETMTVPDALYGRPVRFNTRELYYFGHSQGALVGPLYVAVDDGPRAALFSAGGASIGRTLLDKTEPVNIPDIVSALLGLRGGDNAFAIEGFTMEHPIVSLLQGWIDPADPGNYAPMIVSRPRAGFSPRSVIATQGLRDAYVSPLSTEGLAIALGVPIAEPVARLVPGLTFRGLTPRSGAITGNLPGGRTGALLQFPTQGHFAIFNVRSARTRVGAFFASLAGGGQGTLPPLP